MKTAEHTTTWHVWFLDHGVLGIAVATADVGHWHLHGPDATSPNISTTLVHLETVDAIEIQSSEYRSGFRDEGFRVEAVLEVVGRGSIPKLPTGQHQGDTALSQFQTELLAQWRASRQRTDQA